MPYTQHILGYARESTYGVSPIIDASGTAYKLGITSTKLRLPDPVATLNRLPPSYDKPESQGHWKSAFKVASTFAVGLQDAVLIWFALGRSVTTGASPPYTHTLTCPTVSSGVMPELPSLTLHAENLGSGVTAFVRQFTGLKVAGMRLSCSYEQKYLIAEIDFLGSKAERKTFVLTNKPALIDPTKDKPFIWVNSTKKFDSTAIPGIKGWKLEIDNGVEAVHDLLVDGSGNDASQWASLMLDGAMKKYRIEAEFEVQDYSFWDELVSLVNNKTFEVEFTRVSGSNSLKFSAANCHVVEGPHDIPVPKGENFMATVTMEPESLTVTAVDAIGKTYYGES
jgi:hypothetical protein